MPSLTPKNLHVLTNLKRELLSLSEAPMSEQPRAADSDTPRSAPRSRGKMRHARVRGGSWQRYKQRGGW